MSAHASSFSLPLSLCVLLGAATFAGAAPARRTAGSAAAAEVNPEAFRSAIVMDAASGRVLFEEKADVQNQPASITKLMTFLVVQDKIQRGELTLQTPVIIPAEAAKMGGSEAWLVHQETVLVEELLYLLMVQSANDAAMALAIHTTGSREAFVELMNIRARELGMTRTVFHSPHGLPPGRGQEPDVSTARDLAVLSRTLLTQTDILRYTSTRLHEFRHANGVVNQFQNHNHLLGAVPGCDGLKTGWYAKAGYSLAATVQRNGRRIITVILGSQERKWRDITTTRLIERGFAALTPVVAPAVVTASAAAMPPGAPAAPVPASAANAAAPSAAGSAKPAATTASASSAVTSAGAAESGTPLKLVPLQPGEEFLLGEDPPKAPAVHVNLSGAKK